MSINCIALGKRICFYRLKFNITQEKLAALTNCSREYIAYLESGTKTPSLPTLIDLANVLHSAIGNNLNQIAQYFHSGGFYSKSMQDEINRHLTALWQLRQEAIKLGGTYHGRVKAHRNKKR